MCWTYGRRCGMLCDLERRRDQRKSCRCRACSPRRNVLVGGLGNLRPFESAVHDRLCLLRDQDIFRQYQARRHPAHSNSGRLTVYVQRSAGIYRRIQSMVQAGHCDLPYRIYANNAVVPWTDDIPEQYALGAWHYAGCQ